MTQTQNPQHTVSLAGFGYAVSKTHLDCAALGSHVNILARTVMEHQAAWNRILATRESVRDRERSMTRKNIARLLDFAELCNQKSWPSNQATHVFQVALELAKARDNEMLSRMRTRLDVENSNDR